MAVAEKEAAFVARQRAITEEAAEIKHQNISICHVPTASEASGE